MSHDPTAKLLIIGAHPDDAEYHAGGLAALYRQLGRPVRMISVTDGRCGHHQIQPEDLVPIRRAEAEDAGRVIGAEYHVWDFPDGSLVPSLELRERIIGEIRRYQPALVLTHRTCDYHPDHRAVGQAVQDASFMLTVPHVVPKIRALRNDPVVAYMTDLFTCPAKLRPDVILDISSYLDAIERMLACHRSQVYEWLPYNQCIESDVPQEPAARREWLGQWFRHMIGPRADHFRQRLMRDCGNYGRQVQWVEVFEVSEYAGVFDDGARQRLFPFALAK